MLHIDISGYFAITLTTMTPQLPFNLPLPLPRLVFFPLRLPRITLFIIPVVSTTSPLSFQHFRFLRFSFLGLVVLSSCFSICCAVIS